MMNNHVGRPVPRVGFSWALSPEEAVAMMAGVPARFREAAGLSDGEMTGNGSSALGQMMWRVGVRQQPKRESASRLGVLLPTNVDGCTALRSSESQLLVRGVS